MKYLMIGDLHGKLDIVREVLSDRYEEYHKVFLGDYVDSFKRDVDNQINIVETLLDAVRRRDDVTALIGNHELSYIKAGMECSGFHPTTCTYMAEMKDDILKSFKTHMYLSDDVLVTHAGATKQVFDDKDNVKTLLSEKDIHLYNIGRSRGGYSIAGGIFWCDYWSEFEEIEGLIQVVGHSARRPEGYPEGVVYEKRCYNIDCLDRVKEFLTYDTETLEFDIEKMDE